MDKQMNEMETLRLGNGQLRELLLQALEHERGGVLVYQTALECAQEPALHEEWEKYLEQTEKHVDILTGLCESLQLDPDEMTPGRQVIHHMGKSLVIAMKMALAASDPIGAQRVACDCVVLAETKCHANWDLIGECAKAFDGEAAEAMQRAYDEVEEEEREHLYHTRGWCRELALQALGLEAVIPPPEERQDVKTPVEAAKTEEARKRGR